MQIQRKVNSSQGIVVRSFTSVHSSTLSKELGINTKHVAHDEERNPEVINIDHKPFTRKEKKLDFYAYCTTEEASRIQNFWMHPHLV